MFSWVFFGIWKMIMSVPLWDYRIVSYRIVSQRSYRIVSYLSCRTKSCHITNYRFVSYRIVSYRIVLYRITSYHIYFLWSFVNHVRSIVGLIMRMPCFDNVKGNEMYDDRQFFIVEAQGFPLNEDSEIPGEGHEDATMHMLNGNGN